MIEIGENLMMVIIVGFVCIVTVAYYWMIFR
jgi:hypothetical protein